MHLYRLPQIRMKPKEIKNMKNAKRSLSDVSFSIFNYVILSLFTFICIYPFYYIFIYSLSDPQMVYKGITILPIGLTSLNIISVMSLKNIYHSTLISVLRTAFGTAITLFCCSLFSYILTKKEYYFRKVIYRLTVITLYLNAGLIPYYLTIKAYGLRNTFFIYIFPSAINAFYVILLKTYFEQLPPSLEESAMMDGAGYFSIYRDIIIPLSKPIIATIVVFSAINQWNAWFDNYIFIDSDKLYTLQYILLRTLWSSVASVFPVTFTGYSPTLQSTKMTLTMVAMLPIIIVYPFMQKYFVKGIMLGAIKG